MINVYAITIKNETNICLIRLKTLFIIFKWFPNSYLRSLLIIIRIMSYFKNWTLITVIII